VALKDIGLWPIRRASILADRKNLLRYRSNCQNNSTFLCHFWSLAVEKAAKKEAKFSAFIDGEFLALMRRYQRRRV
jgi:hypothetical protein